MLWVFLAGVIAGGLNAVAGGGSLVSFPTLLLLGYPSIQANASNATGLIPGSLAGSLGLHDRFQATRRYLWPLLGVSLVGGTLGAVLLWRTSQAVFDRVVPFLILAGTLALWLRPTRSEREPRLFTLLVIQFFVSVYGGYFGAGMGIIMLAASGHFLDADVHDLNALKGWLAASINLAAAVFFSVQGLVLWPVALTLMLGSILGGYVAGLTSKRMEPGKLRIAIIVYGFAMFLWFLWKSFGPIHL